SFTPHLSSFYYSTMVREKKEFRIPTHTTNWITSAPLAVHRLEPFILLSSELTPSKALPRFAGIPISVLAIKRAKHPANSLFYKQLSFDVRQHFITSFGDTKGLANFNAILIEPNAWNHMKNHIRL